MVDDNPECHIQYDVDNIPNHDTLLSVFYPFIFILCILLINRVPSGKTRLKYINLIIIGFLLRFIVILEYKNVGM